jgi:hypothetical protein
VSVATARTWLVAAAIAFFAANPIGAGAQTDKPDAGTSSPTYLELLRGDLRRQKAAVIAGGLELSDREATAFWRVYRDYEADVTRIADGRFALLREYAESYKGMSDEKAAELMQRAFALDGERVRLKERYFPRFAAATSARTAARFFQIEGQVEALVYLQLTADLPLFPRPGAPDGPDPLQPR